MRRCSTAFEERERENIYIENIYIYRERVTYLGRVGRALVEDVRNKPGLLERAQRTVAQPGGAHARVGDEQDRRARGRRRRAATNA